MSRYLDRSREIRAITDIHYNCAQGVVVPFAADAGTDEETVYKLAANFGAGMKMGSVCGAVTGALMVLGLFGVDDPQTVSQLYRTVRGAHEGCLECRELLKINAEKGCPKKVHCDGMVFECVQLVEAILREHGKL